MADLSLDVQQALKGKSLRATLPGWKISNSDNRASSPCQHPTELQTATNTTFKRENGPGQPNGRQNGALDKRRWDAQRHLGSGANARTHRLSLAHPWWSRAIELYEEKKEQSDHQTVEGVGISLGETPILKHSNKSLVT
eukprot:Gb_32941 [translate_table: standard]